MLFFVKIIQTLEVQQKQEVQTKEHKENSCSNVQTIWTGINQIHGILIKIMFSDRSYEKFHNDDDDSASIIVILL